jgi:hypothetical protein
VLKSRLKLDPIVKRDPNQGIAEALARSDLSNKALIDAVKGIMMKAPEVQVVQLPAQAQPVPVEQPIIRRPRKWTFTIERDENGLMDGISAKADIGKAIVGTNPQAPLNWQFKMDKDATGLLARIIAEAK